MPSSIRRQVKNVMNNYSEAEKKVREATSNDPWGPASSLMSEIADLTYNVVAFSEIMRMLWRRLGDRGKNWRHVHKALTLMEYLVKTGSERVTLQCRENVLAVQTLADFRYVDHDGRDRGVGVREKSGQLVALLRDGERLKAERTQALRTRERMVQVGGDGRLEFKHGSSQPDLSTNYSEEYGRSGGSPTSYPGSVSPHVRSELEQARPQTSGEEELQLQLALAMSREAAEQEERMRRGDNLRLQMALEESCRESTTGAAPTNSQGLVLMDVMDTAAKAQADQMSDPWVAVFPTPTGQDPWQVDVRPIPALHGQSNIRNPASASPAASMLIPAVDPWAPVPAQTAYRQDADPWGISPGSTSSAQPDPWVVGPEDYPKAQARGDADWPVPSWACPFPTLDLMHDQHYVSGLNDKADMSRTAPETFLSPSEELDHLDPFISMPAKPVHISNPFVTAGGCQQPEACCSVAPPTVPVNPFQISGGPLPTSNQSQSRTPQVRCPIDQPFLLSTVPPASSTSKVPFPRVSGISPVGLLTPGLSFSPGTPIQASQTLLGPELPPRTGCTTNPFLS